MKISILLELLKRLQNNEKGYKTKNCCSRLVCPECKGTGRVNEHYEQIFDDRRYGDHQYHTYRTSDECPRCKGKAYLEKKVTWE